MIVQKRGNIFDSETGVVAHGVNIHGVMGAGIAKEVRQRHPDVYELYKEHCRLGTLQTGMLLPIFSETDVSPRWIFNISSQDAPGAHASYAWLEEGVRKSYDFLELKGLRGIAFPRIGAGIGGLQWARVEKILTHYANEHPEIITELWEFARE